MKRSPGSLWLGVYLLAVILAASASTSYAAEPDRPITLVQDGKPVATIVIRRDAPQVIKQAAEDLQHYVELMSGAKLPIATDDQAVDGVRLLVGHTRGGGVKFDIDLGFDGSLVLTTSNDTLVFRGPNDQGAANGVYWFIEWKLGAHRFGLRNDALVVPQQKTIVIESFNYSHKPSFAWRASWISSINQIYSEEEIANYQQYLSLNRGGGVNLSGAHSLEYLVPPDKYFAEHPEYFPLIDGKRQAHGQLCVSNPDVLRIIVEELKQRDPNVEQYAAVSPNDHAGWCECDACKAMGEDPAARLVVFCNRVVEALEPTHPKLGVCFLAYNVSQTMEPPVGLKAHHRVVPLIAPLSGEAVHPLTDEHCPNSAQLRRIYDGWAQVADQVATYPYMYGEPLENILPTPVPAVVVKDIRYYHDMGVMGLQREHVGHYGARGIGWELSYWLEWQLMWDIDRDVEELREVFFAGYYGGAAEPMKRIYARLENAVMSAAPGTIKRRRGAMDCGKNVIAVVAPTMADNLADIAEARRLADTDAAKTHVAIDEELLNALVRRIEEPAEAVPNPGPAQDE